MKINSNIAISDSGFVFNPSTGESFSANSISISIIEWMKEGKSIEEIIDLVMEKYQIDRDTIEKDLLDFQEMLKLYQITEKDTEELN